MPESTTLYRKYRPQIFADVVGQQPIVTTLTNALKLGRVGQAYLLTGPRGTGKTTLARLFAKAINCSARKPKSAEPCNQCQHCLLMAEGRSLDVTEIDAASHTGVDNIRTLRETIQLPPTLGSHKIYIIDEVHMLSLGAFNALLKTLEEPPAHVVFILATTALHKVPDTIISRCQRFDLIRFPVTLITQKLRKITTQEKLHITDGALEMIALTAEGGMRDAESLLTQIASLDISPITEDTIIEILGTTKQANIVTLLQHISNRELYPGLAYIRHLTDEGIDFSLYCGALLRYLRDVLLVSADMINGPALLTHLTPEQQTTLTDLAKHFTPDDIVRMLEHFQIASADSKTSVISELPLEIAFVKILAPSTPPDSATTTSAPMTLLPTPTANNIPSNADTTKKPSSFSKIQTSTITTTSIQSTDDASVDTISVGTSVTLATVHTNWQKILDTAKKLNASLTLGLSTARPIKTHGTLITIAVKYPFHKERLDEPANQLTLQSAFDTILGLQIKIAIVLEDTRVPDNDVQQPVKTSEKDSASDVLINQAMKLLGGTMVNEA